MKYKIVAVVVTYNRKELLLECLDSIFRQTIPIDKLILIDNASSDGSKEALYKAGYFNNEKFEYHRMESNIGCTGGFDCAYKYALDESFDWLWMMDDDAIPSKDCLEELVKYINPKYSFLASSVYSIENLPMNVPTVDMSVSSTRYPCWYDNLEKGLVRISSATWVSILVNFLAVKKCGLPCKEYFLWGDDTEYTSRLTSNFGPAYLVGSSFICHKRKNAAALDILTEIDVTRIKNFHYMYRNNLFNTAIYSNGKFPVLKRVINNIIIVIKIFVSSEHKMDKIKAVIRGTVEGVIYRKRFAHYINSQIK